MRRNGFLELQFNHERSQALANIYPPGERDGAPIEVSDVLARLKNMGVTYGIREDAILDATHHVCHHLEPITNFVVAQGAVPEDGVDGRIKYHLPLETLTIALEKSKDGSGLPDWFALNPAKMVKAEEELAAIALPQSGKPGKTLTWPIKDIPAKMGKPAEFIVGANCRLSEDGTRLFAEHDGYAVLHNDQITVYPLRRMEETVSGGEHWFPKGAVFMRNVQQAKVTTGSFLAIRGVAFGCHLRAHGDVILTHAENCTIIAEGNVYIRAKLKNCKVVTRKKIIALGAAEMLGGEICGAEGVEAMTLGAEDATPTLVLSGADLYSPLRDAEIEQELATCQENTVRISQTLKPFATLTVQSSLTDEKRLLFQRLQAQLRTQEARTKELHNERRSLAILMKERLPGMVSIAKKVYPGVQIVLQEATFDVDRPLEQVQFVPAPGGKSVLAAERPQAA